MTPKELFLTDEKATQNLRAVVNAHWFKQCLVSVRAQFLSQPGLTNDKLQGALLYESILLELPNEALDYAGVETGLQHDIDNPRTSLKPPTPAPIPSSPNSPTNPI